LVERCIRECGQLVDDLTIATVNGACCIQSLSVLFHQQMEGTADELKMLPQTCQAVALQVNKGQVGVCEDR